LEFVRPRAISTGKKIGNISYERLEVTALNFIGICPPTCYKYRRFFRRYLSISASMSMHVSVAVIGITAECSRGQTSAADARPSSGNSCDHNVFHQPVYNSLYFLKGDLPFSLAHSSAELTTWKGLTSYLQTFESLLQFKPVTLPSSDTKLRHSHDRRDKLISVAFPFPMYAKVYLL
jgi:hypothetical protein